MSGERVVDWMGGVGSSESKIEKLLGRFGGWWTEVYIPRRSI